MLASWRSGPIHHTVVHRISASWQGPPAPKGTLFPRYVTYSEQTRPDRADLSPVFRPGITPGGKWVPPGGSNLCQSYACGPPSDGHHWAGLHTCRAARSSGPCTAACGRRGSPSNLGITQDQCGLWVIPFFREHDRVPPRVWGQTPYVSLRPPGALYHTPTAWLRTSFFRVLQQPHRASAALVHPTLGMAGPNLRLQKGRSQQSHPY